MSAAPRAAVATIAAHLPFLDTLAARLSAETGDDPLALARITILLPTRRACRALAEAFLRRSDGKPLLLPRLEPVGDLDAEELAFLADEAEAADLELPPAIPELRRQLLLARLVRAARPQTCCRARRRRWRRRPRALPRRGADRGRRLRQPRAPGAGGSGEHWQDILKFLGIVTETGRRCWRSSARSIPPSGATAFCALQAERWRNEPPADPVIAAGLTGGVPAVADADGGGGASAQRNCRAAGPRSRRAGGCWAAIRADPAHPQHLLAAFLERLELTPAEVEAWEMPGLAAGAARADRARRRGAAAGGSQPSAGAMRGVSAAPRSPGCAASTAPGPQEEAQAIALLLREPLERRPAPPRRW